MTPERLRQIEDLYHRALEKEAGQRPAFLREKCSGDEPLRREVESLLDQTAGGPFISSAAAEPEHLDSPKPDRPTWWMYIIGASYVLTFAVIAYLIIWGPADPYGTVADFARGAMVIRAVVPDSQPAKAGVRAGDRVLAIDDHPMRAPSDWAAASGNVAAGRAQRWLIARGDDRVSLDVVSLRAARFRQRVGERYIEYSFHLLSGFILGLLIAWKRPADPVARIGAWFFMTAAIAFGFPSGWAVPWRQVPIPVQWLLWIPQLSRFVIEGIFLSFFLVFPRRLVTRRWMWFAVWVPVVATLPWRIASFYAVIQPGSVAPVPGWILQIGFARTILYLLGGIVILILSDRGLVDVNEKRRVRVLIVGTAISVIFAVALTWLDSFYGRNLNRTEVLFLFSSGPLNSAFYFAWAYAILRHRVLGVSVIIRQGLQYALARGAVIGVVPALAAGLVLDLALNSEQPLAAIMRSRGWVYGGLAVLALMTYWNRKQWLELLDRRFFRERYNAQRVLRDVVDEIREARSFERVAPLVIGRIDMALHPEFVAVVVRDPDEPYYRTLVSFPAGHANFSLNADSKLVALMRMLTKPLEGLYSSSAWLQRGLPEDDIRLVRRTRMDLLVPIALAPGRKEAVLALGVKKSEEPYTGEDQELLEAIASSLGLLFERPVSSGGLPAAAFQECPECGTCYEATSSTCAHDGTALRPAHVSRTLVGRYRLEKRRGRGGMGTVYEAIDEALERRVAVKLIREDLVGNAEAAQRFRREARAAASFAHPNVVTVYDFGIEADTQAFLVMELLDGVTLRDELDRSKRLDSARLIEILRAVCSAVEAAHRRHLIHRDLKPENIFLARGGDWAGEVVKVLDFGIAKFISPQTDDAVTHVGSETQTGILVGTPAYMSPGQLSGEAPDVQWDLWALAVVVYESLIGAKPFEGSSVAEWHRKVLAGDFAPPGEQVPGAPDRWSTFFAHSFAANPAQRPPSAAKFLRNLEETLLP